MVCFFPQRPNRIGLWESKREGENGETNESMPVLALSLVMLGPGLGKLTFCSQLGDARTWTRHHFSLALLYSASRRRKRETAKMEGAEGTCSFLVGYRFLFASSSLQVLVSITPAALLHLASSIRFAIFPTHCMTPFPHPHFLLQRSESQLVVTSPPSFKFNYSEVFLLFSQL